ncbi:intermembrane lipid transfer protein VPS13B-like [Clytia hemisphaerica]
MIPELNSGVSQILPVEEPKTTKKSPATSLKLRKVLFETKGLHVVYSSTENISLKTGWHELNMEGTLGYNGDGGEMKEISSEVHWSGLFLSTKLNNDEMNLLSPLQMKINSQLQFSRDRPPMISISLVCGLIEFNIYQEFVEIFEQLNTGMKMLLPTMYPQSKADSSSAAEKPVVVSNVGGDDEKGDCVENVTVDDLRNGSFEYILVEDGIERTPCEMQVTFSSELDLVAPVMTWCYNEPRVITQLVSLPVPFHIPRDLTDQSDTAILEVDCCVQYFNEIQEEFVTCGTFCLSENNSSSIILCDEKMLPNTTHYQSILWRIVIATAANSSRFNLATDLQNGRAPLKISPIPATSLAACLKINSCACPSLQPHFRCKADVKNLKVILRNPMESEIKETKFPHDVPSSIESLELNLTSLNTSLMTCPSKALLHSNASFHVATMDFHDLCWIDLISPTAFSLQLCKELKQISNDPHPVEDVVVLQINEMDVLLSQSSLHTLLMTNQLWSSLSKESSKSTILNHYVIRNRTEDVILFKQCEQEEELRLESGHTYPYSLFDHSSHSLQFCLEQVENCAWSNDVRLNVEGVTTCVFEHEGYTSKLIVETKLIGGLQYEVVVHGSCSFINNTSCPLHLKVITQKTENTLAQSQVADVTHSYNLSSDDGQISLTASCDYIKEFCLYAGSRDDPIRADDNTDKVQFHKDLSKMFKMKVGGDMFWVSFDQKKELANQTIVTFHPLFVVRNHLSQDITIQIGEETTTVNLPAKGQETQISAACIDEEQTLKVTLDDHQQFTWTDITLSSSTHLKLNESKTLCNPHLNACNWPYAKTETTKSSPNDSPGKTITLTDQNEQQVDIIIEFSLKWEHLQTVVMDIKPCMLFCNETSRTLHIKAKGGPSWSLERSSVRHVFEMKEFSLMVQESTTRKDVWSPVIALTDQTLKSNNDVLQKQSMKIGTTSYVTLLDKENNVCYQIVVQSKRCDGMIIMVLKERFALRNLSNENVKVVPVMFQKPDAFKVLPSCTSLDVNNSSTLPFSMLNISTESTLKHDKELPEGLAMNFILGQCDQGNQETSLINHHLTNENTFVLSEDHLREYIHLKNSKNDISTFVLSSYLDEGVINICIADDSHPVVQITNKCSVILALREEENVNEKTTHHPVLESNMEKLYLLKPNIQTSFVPNNFKTTFPKLTNPIEFHCQFALYVANSVELSKPIKLSNHSSVTDLYVPAFGHITLTSFVHNSQLFVEIGNEGKDNVHPKTIHCLPFPNFNLNITSLDVILIDRINSQDMNAILSLSTSDLQIEHTKTNAKDKSSIQLSVGNLQLDNQISEDIRFHFPVILLPMRKISQRYHKVTSDAPFADIQASPDADFFTLKILLSKKDDCTSLDDVELCIQPFEMFLEDAYIYRLAELMKNYLPNIPGEQHATVDPISSIRPVLFPLKTCKVHIAEISFLLSIHASVKVFLAADHIPLKLGAFDCQPTQTIRDEFVRVLLYHYATQVLVRVGWILGSLELIGNPTGLIHSIGRGISDFVTMPYHGLTRGPTAFVSGISHGLSSFVKHVSTGTLTSITNVSSSISRNLDRLCLDETHIQMQEERRAQVPTQTLSGLNNAMGSLGMSLLSAVAGLVDHSIQNISSANSTQEAVTGAFSGLAKGVLGVFTKPLGGAMEFVSQTSQGILQGAGFVNIPERVNIFKFNDEVDSIGKRKSTSKILWKYLHCKETPFTFIAPCTNNTKTASKYSSFNDWLIITSSAVFLLDQEKGVVKMAFPLSDVEPHRQENETKDHVKLLFSLQRNHIEPSSTQNENLNHVLNMRQFFDSFDAACLTTKVEEMSSSSASKTGLSEHVLCVLMAPLDAELFLLNFHMAQK